MLNVVLIGAGNLGFHLYRELYNSEKINFVQWYNRRLKVIKFAEKKISITDRIDNLKDADLYIICIKDDLIKKISSKIKTTSLIVHTSGGASIKEINSRKRRGVFYPVQTFLKSRHVSFKNIPICIEAEKNEDLITLKGISEILKAKAHIINSEQRKIVHLAAVFVNNFTNHLYTIAKDILKSEKIPFDFFYPLIKETIDKAILMGPDKSQTGPAKRGDRKTIQEHKKILSDKEYNKLYLMLTQLIEKRYE